jgi:hypothetical protein
MNLVPPVLGRNGLLHFHREAGQSALGTVELVIHHANLSLHAEPLHNTRCATGSYIALP